MISRLRPFLSAQELIAASAFWQTKSVEEFEQAFAKLMEAKYAVAFPYGRTGLITAINALDVKDKEIICPAYTCVVVAHAIKYSGNIPVFVDSLPGVFNMDWTLVEQAISERTGAIIATSIFGYPVDLDALASLRKKYPHIRIIQDCAHSFSARWNEQTVQNEGDCAIYGLNISKLITSIFGGMVTTNNVAFYQRLIQLRNQELKTKKFIKSWGYWLYLQATYWGFKPLTYGLVNRLERSGWLKSLVKYYDEGLIDMPKDYQDQMQPIQARVGLVQCKKYSQIISHRAEIAAVYTAQLQGISDLILPQHHPGATYSHYVVQTPQATALIQDLNKQGIQLGELIDYHIPSMSAYIQCTYFSNKISEHWPGQVINLPVHQGVSLQDAAFIVNKVKIFFSTTAIP